MTNISMILLENCWIISVQLCWNYVFVMKFNISVRKNTYSILQTVHTQTTLNIAYTRHTETEENSMDKNPFPRVSFLINKFKKKVFIEVLPNFLSHPY